MLDLNVEQELILKRTKQIQSFLAGSVGINSNFLSQDTFIAFMQWGYFYMLQTSADMLHVNMVRIIN